MKTLAAFAVLLLAGLAGCATGAGPDETLVPTLSVPNFHAVAPGVATSGQPSPRALESAFTRGYGTVVNLRTAKEGAGEEGTIVSQLGMRYVSIPIGKTDLGWHHADRLAEAMDGGDDKPVLLHCKSSNRAGALWALYSAKHLGLGTEQAMEEGRRAGLTKLDDRVEALFAEGVPTE